jgi:Holliday junction resolvase
MMSKKPIKPESAIQKEILDYLNRLPYTVAWKVMQANERGVPDVIACRAGLFYAFEVKRPGASASPLQIEQMKRIWAAGGKACVVEGVEDVVEAMKCG